MAAVDPDEAAEYPVGSMWDVAVTIRLWKSAAAADPIVRAWGARRRRVTYDEYNAYCGSLPATSYVRQWGGAHVWKVGGKVFAIGGWDGGGQAAITFKVSEISYEILRERPGLRPAPYLASRGMKWIQHYAEPGLSDEDLLVYIGESHRIVALGLSRKKRVELGLGLD